MNEAMLFDKDDPTMTTQARDFRGDKQALIARLKSLLHDAVVSNSRSARSRAADAVSAAIDELGGMVEQVIAVKADMISEAIVGKRKEIAEPAICSTCLNRLTESAEQVNDYIEAVVQQARGFSWSADVCREKLRQALRPGDRVIQLGYGRLAVGRPDGSAYVIYQRDS